MSSGIMLLFFFNDTATTEIYTLSLHDALPICSYMPQGPLLIEVVTAACPTPGSDTIWSAGFMSGMRMHVEEMRQASRLEAGMCQSSV